jgi:hypothetical protein
MHLLKSTLDWKQLNVDSGLGKGEPSSRKAKVEILTGFSLEKGEMAAVEGTSFPFEREEAVEG